MDLKGDLDILKAYNLFRRISSYPTLLKGFRETFLDILEEKGITSRERILQEARQGLEGDDLEPTEGRIKEYREALIDLYFATYIERHDDYINLVRKRERAQNLVRVLHTRSSSSLDIYRALREFCEIPKGGVFISRDEAEGIRVSLINHFISSHLAFIGIAKNHLTIRDVDSILERTLWDKNRFGKLGGKAAGMILAKLVLLPTLAPHDPELDRLLTIPETWFLDSEIFTSYLERNGLYFTQTFKYKEREEIESEYSSVEERFQSAHFSDETLEMFRELLRQIGEHPIIVRSSSHLEDSVGLAFSGKYESVFLANQGSLDERLQAFLVGLKRVLASVYMTDPILYRRAHGLLDFNEQMAVIVQKVVGRRFGDYFFPFAAGVLFSYNSYRWSPRIESEKGLARIVFGLGTRAVDRVGSDYPRMIPLCHPELRPEATTEQILKYSQKQVDVINLKENRFETVDFMTLVESVDHPELIDAVSIIKDGAAMAPLHRMHDFKDEVLCLSFERLIRSPPFLPLVRKILDRLEKAYGKPVDVEFAWDEGKLYLLQCRTLSTRRDLDNITVPEKVQTQDTLFRVHSGISDSVVKNIEYVIYVDPKAYNSIERYEDKVKIVRVVNNLNHILHQKRFALLGPGRWGSNDVNLGVPVKYGDINNARVLIEIAIAHNGMTPEVSYGTHFFQDLVESDIAILPIFPDTSDDYFDEQTLLRADNRLGELIPEYRALESVVRVVCIPDEKEGKVLEVILDGRSQDGIGYFTDPGR